MRLYRKEGNTIQIISYPEENIEKGDYLIIEDSTVNKGLVAQVIDAQFANVPGILEELLRDSTVDQHVYGENFDPLDMAAHVNCIQDSLLLICKIRGSIENGKLNPNISWLPSRTQSKIKKMSTDSLLKLANNKNGLPITLGETKEDSPLIIDAHALDGRLNIVTGKKETGKSHLSKLLALSLIEHGATVVVLDLNGEYTKLNLASTGEKNKYHGKIHVLTSGDNFKVTLAQIDLRVMLNILFHALNLPGTSAREFRQIWKSLERRCALTLQELGEAIRNSKCNQHVKDALFSRYYGLINSGFFTDNPAEATTLEENLDTIRKGGALIINLRDTSTVDRQIIVEYVLGKLVELLTQYKLRAVFLFAEEAHLYLRETYWDDIVTRMRHFGIFTTFVTNQPDTIRQNIYRQADNIFLFNFTNENDLETVSRAARVDAETVKLIARDLPPHHCLVLGNAVRDFPIVTKVRCLDIQTMGQTRLFFTD
jgi:DNA helicase HerA-like ATPase